MRPTHRPAQGFTLVELLVAMALGLTVIALASSGLLLARQGMQLVDQSTQLQDRERLARDVITRLLRQASAGLNGDQPALYGWDNAAYRKPETLDFLSIHKIHNGSRPGHCGKVRDSSCLNGSDIVAVRLPSGSALSHCGGTSAPVHPVNLLYLARSSTGEPGLYCAYPSANDWVSVPLIEGVESRTSSPVRILRDERLESDIRGLFPCGEGAGYAGGITSAAMDGIKVAEEIAGRIAYGEQKQDAQTGYQK